MVIILVAVMETTGRRPPNVPIRQFNQVTGGAKPHRELRTEQGGGGLTFAVVKHCWDTTEINVISGNKDNFATG